MGYEMIVREMESGENARWDLFVNQCEYCTPQLLSGWKNVMEEALGSKTHYLMAEDHGEITGILPLIHVNSLLAGHYFTSFPGGLCANDIDTAAGLLGRAKKLVISKRANYLILRDGRKKWDFSELITDEEHVTFHVEIKKSIDQIRSMMHKKDRQMINQITSTGLEATLGFKHLESYYPVYIKAMHQMGTPTFGIDFFRTMGISMPAESELITLFHQSQIVGGGFIAPYKDIVYCLWSGLLPEYYKLRTSYRLIWEAIKYAYEEGYRRVDLGRCGKSSGGFDFKRRFGGQVQQLYQQVYLNNSSSMPLVGSERKSDYKSQLFVRLWRNLPLGLTEVLGPYLRRQMPFG